MSRAYGGRAARSFSIPLLITALPSCVSSSIASDMRHVRDATRVERLAPVTDEGVDPTTAGEARRLLRQPIDASAAVRIALLNNRELRARLREVGIARGQLIQAGLFPNPRAEVELLPERNSQVELRVEYDVTRALLVPYAARSAEPQLEAARSRAAGAVVMLGYRVREAFYRLQASEQRWGISQQLLDASAARRDAASAMLQAGNVAELEAASEEAAYERGRVASAELELEVATEREGLSRLLGLHGADTSFRLRGALEPVPDEIPLEPELERKAVGASFALQERRQRLEGLARRAGFTKASGWLPDVSIDVHGLHGNPDDDLGATQTDWRFGAGISLDIPVFDRRQGTVVALEAEFDALLESYYGLAIDVRSAAREARSRLVSAHARARQYQNVIVPAQRRVTEQTLLHYNAMQLGIFQLLGARREELDVQLEYVEALRQYWSAVAEVGALVAGRHVEAGLPAADEPRRGEASQQGEH